MNTAVQQAASLNNQGVDALLRGDKKSALRALTMSIKLMKAALPDAESESMDIHDDADDDTKGAGGCSSSSSSSRLPTTSITVPPSVVASCDDTVVFNQAILIPAESIPSSLTAVDMNIYTGAVIYNLALVHQSVGSQQCLDKAEKLYCLVLQLLDASTLSTRTALIVKLGCINNLSQIRYSNGDYDNVQEGLSHVSYYFMQQQGGESSSTSTMSLETRAMFEEPMVQSLLMNVLLLRPPSAASAA